MVTLTKDLRSQFGPARDQGSRPTCLAFATSDLHAASRSAPFAPLSVEYLYFHAVQRSNPPKPHRGVRLKAIIEAMKLDGQPIESDWPYLANLPYDLSAWTPPSGLSVFRKAMSSGKPSPAIVIAALDNDRAAMLCLRASEAFYRPNGIGVVERIKNDPDTGNHAVVAVGHGSLGGDHLILVRNSWGADWGINGHGWLHEEYLSARLLSFSLMS